MQSGGAQGMQTMDSALLDLVNAGRIKGSDAYLQANHKEKFERVRSDA